MTPEEVADGLHESSTESKSNTAQTAQISPWIRHRIEYRSRITDELLHGLDVGGFNDLDAASLPGAVNEPIFEKLRIYTVSDLSTANSEAEVKKLLALTTYTTPRHCIRVLSMPIINALRSVVRYYPEQDLSGDSILIYYPYPVLVHHYDELLAFRDRCDFASKSDLCERERDASVHLVVLLNHIDAQIMPEVRLEQERLKRGYSTWQNQWISLKPGTTIIVPSAGSEKGDRSSLRVVHSVEFGAFTHSLSWTMVSWSFHYTAEGQLERREWRSVIETWDGEVSPKYRTITETDAEASKFIENGKAYYNLMGKQCRYYKGKSRTFPFNEVSDYSQIDLLV